MYLASSLLTINEIFVSMSCNYNEELMPSIEYHIYINWGQNHTVCDRPY